MPDNKRKLYDVLSKDYDLGTFEQFSNDLNDEEKRKKAYQAVSASYDVGDFDKFSADLGITKAQPVVADQTQTARMDAPDATPVQKDTVVQPVVQSPVVEDAPEDLNFDDEPQGPAREPEKIRGFFPALGQGAKNMYYGLVNLAGEAAQLFSGRNIFNPLSWGSRNAQEALDELEHRLQAGVDPHTHAEPEYQQMVAALNNPDLTKKQKREAMEQYNKYLEEQWGYHPFTSKGRDRMQHSVDIDLMIEAALKRADGDVEEARRILAGKAGDLSLGDKMSQYAAEGLAQSKETEGFGAWLGQQIPMLLPSAVAIGMSAYTKNPKYAEWIGKGSFGLMATSSAGEAMNQARQYGATDNEVWAAGFTDAAIMYAAGKIPFNRYTGRLFNGAKKQAAAELSAALADESSLAAKEAEELFKRAAKELGGKFNWKEYMADIAAHGATMGSMSALQTMVPMIYEHPEDYPTLWEIVQNGVRGVRDGVFLGSTLGAATQGMKVRNNRARWKEQGGIMFAEMEGEGGEPVMAEVIGMDGKSVYLQYELGPDGKPLRDTKGNPILKNKWKAGDGFIKMNGLEGAEGEATGVPEGTVEILIDGKLESISKEEFRRRVRDVGYKSFGDVEQAEVQMQTDNAYEQGYDVHEPQPRHDAQNMYEYQRRLLKDKTGLDDVSVDDVMFYYESENWTPEQKEAVLDYLKAKSARKGMIDGIRDEIKRKIVAATTAIDNNTSKTDGKIHPATMKDDRRAYIVDGTVVMTEDGTMVDPSKSMHDVLMRDAETGELFFASSDQILSVDDAIDPLAEKQTVAQGIREGIAQDAADQIDGIVKFNANDVYTVLTPEGNSFPIQIVPNEQGIIDNGDGTVNVILNPQEGMANAISQMPKDQIQAMVNAYNLQRLDNYITRINELRAKSEAEDLPEAEAPATPVAPAEGAAPVEAPEAEQPLVPIDDKGRKQYMQAPKEATYEDIYSDEDFDTDEEAYGFISGKVKRAEDALKKQQAAVDKVKPENFDSPSEYRTAKNAALEAARPFQETYDYWKSVLELADADIAAAKAREERAARMEEAALLEPMSLEEVAANGFRGMEHQLDKADFKKETGLSDTELKKFFPFWAKKGQGISVQGLAEAIAADDQSGLIPKVGDADQFDTQAVRNAILEVFRSAARPSDIYEYTRNANLWRREEMERAEAEAAENARLEAEAAAAAQEAEPVVEEPAATEQPETSTAPEVEAPQTPLQQSIAEEAAKVNPEPTDAQKEAGNYQKGHIQIDGYDITIETAKGTVRRGTDADGKPWESEMHQNYGYIRRTEGTDGDHIDVFLSDTPEQGNVFVVDQVDPKTGAFDEHKVMYGFNSMEEAKAAYLSNYEEGWQGLGNITEVSREEFKKWVDSSHRKTKPFAEYKSVKPVEQAPQAETMDPQAIVDVYSQIEATKAEDKGKPGRKEILEALYQANPQLVQFRNEQDQLNAVSDVIALARQYPDLAISKAILEKVAPAEATAAEPAAPAEGEQGVINFDNSEAPAATEETAPEVPVPATKEEARAALDKTITTEKGEMMLPEILYVNTAIREMDPTGRELRDAPTTQKSAPGIIPHLKNYIDILAAEYGKKLEQFGSPEGVVKYANDRLAELNKKVKSDEILPADYEAAVQDAVDAVGMLIRKMRYDMPSTAHRADYDYLDTSDFNKAVLQLLSKASPDVLAQLAETKNLPWAASGIIRRAIEREQLLKDVQTYRQMYFEQHPEMPSATPKGKFDIWKFVAKDKQRPAMTGVFHDKGFKVASDTHILVAVKEAYPKENEGKIIDKKKNVIKDAKYPKWRDLIQKGEDAGIDIDHLASFIEGVKEMTGADFTSKKFYDGVKIALPIGGEMRLFPAEPLATFLRAAKEIGGTITYRNLGESGKSMMLQAEGKGGYALIMNTMPSNWSSPMFHWYATPAELEQMAKKLEQDHVVAEATSLVTGKPVEEIEAESRPTPVPRTPQEKWDAAAKGLSEAKTAEERAAAMELRRQALQDKLNDIADDEHPVGVVTYDNVMDQLKQDGVDADTIAEVRDGLELDNPNRDTNRAFFLPFDGQGIYIIADDITSLEDGVSAYVHERQHGITLAGALDERLVSTPGFDRKVIWEAMKKWNAGRWYEQKDDITLADEFLSMAMDLAYKCDTPDVFEQELRKAGIDNEEIITFVKNLDNEQRNSEPLSSARQVTLFQDSEQGSRGEDDRDSGEQSGGNLGEEGNRPAQSSEGSPAKRSSSKREVKSGPTRQIEDFGEKIAGARKDELRNLSKTLEDATEQSFVELPLGKAFKRPNTKKLVENGIISEEDAALVDAVSWLIQGSPKPVKLKDRSYKARRRDQEIVDWARQQAGRAKVLLDYINADAEGKKAIIAQLVEVPQDVKVAADAHRNHIIELNKGWKDLKAGELYPINPIYIAYRVFQSTGYNPEVNGRIKFPIIKCDDMGRTYTVKSGNYGYEYAYSVEQALEQATYLVQLQMGVEDLDHPSSAFRVKGIRDKKIGSGRFLVHYWSGSGMRAHYAEQEFDNYQSALEFAKKKFPDRTEEEIKSTAIDEIQKWADPTQFKIVATNSATGDTYELPGDYSSLDEARSAIDSEHETLNAAFNDALREAREKKGEAPASKREKLYVAWYYENGKGTYGVWAKDKGFWQGTELLKGGFETSKEAREFMEAHRDEYEKQLKEMVQKRSEFVYFDGDNKSRKGKDYRHGKDVGEEEYKAFGFRGVQFGNWANDADRQAALNNAYDSFMHLAELLGVSLAAISLNGELGLAFGARGSGNANAHYESGEVVINLTKTRGAGSLAHEWWHALDNYFARRGGIPHGFATATNIPEMRPELRDAFRTLADVVSKSNYGKRSKNKGDYWGSNWELTARLFAEWLDRRIEDAGESDHFLVRGVGDDIAQRWMDIGYRLYQYRMKAIDRKPEEILSYEDYIKTPEALAGFPYPTTQEIKETFGPLMQNIFDIIQEKSEDGKSVLFSKEVRPITTYHGSAASFDHFDLQFLGSGEGTYVYGPGVYVTEVDGIAKSYADVATGNRLAENRDGIERQQERLQEIRAHYLDVIKRHEDFAAAHEGTEAAESHRKFAGYFRYMLETGDYKYDPEAKQVSDNIKWRQEQNTHEGKRHLYTVEIPGDNGHNYFKYGKQLPREDAMRIKAALRSKLLADPNSGWDMKVVRELDDELNMAFKDIWGEHIIGTLDAYLGNDGIGLKSTKFLHDLGYVGMKVDTNNGDPHGDHTHNNYVIFDPNDARITDHVRYSKMTQWPAEDREQSRVRFSKVTDEKVLKELEEGETQIGYRNVVLNADGSLGSPMADKLGKKGEKSVSTVPFSFDEWEQADEHPEMATDDGKINLIKPDKLGNVDAVDYNPYIHIRPTLINKQFTGAWKRPNLVYVATAYPSSELTSGYHAEKAAKAVGRHDWNGGELILSRYDKPVRIVSWDEVADEWVKEFKERGVTFDIVPPGLLPVLVERGLEILPPKVAAGKSAMAAYERFVNGGRVRFSKAYHGTDADFENFDLSNAGKGEGLHAHGFGHYVTEDKNVARNYAYRLGGTDEQIERAIGSISGQIAADQIRLKNAKTDMARRYYEDAIAASERRIEQMKNSRHIYTVEIPDDNGENYIDEMRTLAKPLRRRVAEAVRNIPEEKLSRTLHGPNWLPEGFKTLANIIEREQYAGLEIRQRLVDALGGGPKAERYASEVLHSAGFVGFKYNGRQDGPCAVIFNDEDIKVSSHVRFSKTNADEHIFISNAENALDNIKMEKATPEQWLKMLEKEGGLKAGEDKWIGLSDWLRASDKKTITKEEVHDFIRKNEIVIEETHYAEHVDTEHAFIDDVTERIARGKSLDELQEEVDELKESGARYDAIGESDEGLDAFLMQAMKDEYGDDFELGFYIEDGELDYNYDPYSFDTEDFNEYFAGDERTKIADSTRLSYTTDGLENKQEIALTVPTIEPYQQNDHVHFGDAGNGRAIAWVRFGDAAVRRGFTPEEIDAMVAKVPAAENWRKEDGSQFVAKNDLYYPDVDGLDGYFISHNTKRNSFVVHGPASRIFGEFETLPEAVERVKEKYREKLSYNEVRKRVLFIDEIQSKRHQNARERGYRSSIPAYENPIIFPQNLEVTEDERQYHTTFRGVTYDVGKGVVGSVDEAKAYFERLINHDIALRNDELGSKKQKAVPDAPFEKNWHELAFKRMLRYAADEGYDVVAWTTGDQQAERYNIGGIVDSIERREHYNLGERDYRINVNGKGNQDLVTDDDGNVIRSLVADFRGKKLSDIVGKEMAQKMLQMSENDVISGEDLRVGGDGMKGFYDDILPRFVNKYGKKWGASTGDILVELSNGVHLDAHSVEVTPAMKESVQKGQVMFSKTQREKGPFGTILRGYEGRAKEAIQKLIEMQEGEAIGALSHPDIGAIDLVWGEAGTNHSDGYGLAKLVKFHPEVVDNLQDILNDMHIVSRSENRINLESDKYKAAVRLSWDDQRKTWLLTVFEKKNSALDNTTDTAKTSNGSERNDTATPQDTVSGNKDSENSDTAKPSGKKSLFSKLARPVDEIVEEGRQRVANENEDARVHLNERMRAIDKNLAKMRMAASAQREYDRETVRSITDLAKELLNNGALSDVTRQEIEKMLTVTRWATGRKDLQGAVDAIMDLMVANQLRHSKGVLDGLLKIRGSKVDARGIEVQGKLDAPGQRTMQVFKDAMDMSLDSIDEHIAAAEERLDSSDDTIKAAAGDELVGLQFARKYVEDIKSSIDEEKGIKNELRQAAEDRRAGKMAPASYHEFVESSEEALRQNRMERIEAYNTLVDGLSKMLYESITRGTAFREAEKERVERIHHFANSDLEGSKDDEHGNKNDRFANNGLVRFLLKPLATFDQMLRHFGSKSVNGEGYLWNHFMRGWVDANDAEFKGLQEATKALDAKVSDVFGRKMRWSDLYSVESKMPTVDIKFWDGGKMQDHKLTQGNLLYIYMVNKMSDGRMKLRRMGIEEEHVQAIKAQMDPRFIELADWLQDEFLVGVRNKYNKVYEAMFGASMPAIENYFPLKILANARVREVDMSTPDMDGTTPATITGSIIKRRRNGLALDVMGSDAFSVVIEHLQQMEHWAAFAPFNRDLNTLLSYKKFRNRVQNMSGIYGAGSVIWENFRKSAEIAAGVYRPAVTRDSVDSTAVNIAKGVTAAKISFRVYTAIKQLLSMPAFISDADPALLGKSMATPWVSWNWAMKELPGFEKRWMSKQAGDTRLMKTDSDWKLWRHNLVKTASRLGMSPNAFVDALTISIGAKAMYDTRLKKYLKDGYTREQADKRAKQDATILFNETQQSNENAYLSAMQLDRTWASVALTVFRNSAMGYQRQLVDAVRNLSHKLRPGYKEQAIEFMAKQMVRDGVDEEDAKAAAERNYKKSTFRDAMRVALFGFVMQLAWNLGSYLPYLLAGDDDNDKKKMLQDAARHGILGGLVEGLTGGSVISEAANMLASGEGIQNYSPSLMPVASDIQKVIKLMSYDQVAAANEILNLLVQAGVGVNPQTLTDVGVAIYDACHGDPETSKEATLLIMRILQVPQSQTDKILMDGIDFTAEKGLDMTISEFAGRYADYKVRRNAATLGWLYSDEDREKRVNTYAKRFTKQAEELKRTRGNDLDKAYYEYVDNEYKQVDATLRDLRSGVKAATQSGDQLGAMEYAEMLNNFMTTPEYMRYAQVHGYQNAIKRLTSALKNANPQDRDQIEDQLLQVKRQMVNELQTDNK